MRPSSLHKFKGCRIVGANPLLARVAGDPLYCTSGTAERHPIQNRGLDTSHHIRLAARRRQL
jgi:hypothetical protein